jgi:tetratricopeptide (TPR) repeat protein
VQSSFLLRSTIAVKLSLYIVCVTVIVSLLFRQFEAPWVAFRKGETAFAHGNFAAAAQFYQQAAEKLDDARILDRLVHCWWRTGDIKDEETLLARILERHSERLDTIELLAGAYQQAQEPEKAIPLFTQYLARGGKLDSFGKLQLARVYRQAGHYDQAAPYYLQAVEDPKQKIAAMTELAEMRSWQGAYDEAIALLRKVLVAEPTNRPARLSLARILSWAGDYKESEDEYRELLSKP